MTNTHVANAAAFLTLGITGILLLPAPFSSLREILLGGRFEVVRDVHLWSAVPFGITLIAVYALRGWAILKIRRLTALVGWKKLNSILALALSILLFATGVLLWIEPEAAAGWLPISRSIHVWSTWAVLPWVLLHASVEGMRWMYRRRRRFSFSSTIPVLAAGQALPVCTEEVKTP
ncbi:MAG: hypothetical protein HYT87_14435 [Nitrospirae bacterium]|nr:hypothetical protein [Nitrospirota bacterium]